MFYLPLSVLLLHVSARFARLFHSELDRKSCWEKRPGILSDWSVDVCSVWRQGRIVLFSEEHSLFTFAISSGYSRSMDPVLEEFHRRREQLARELGLSGLAPFSVTKVLFDKRTNRHIIGSQNDLIHLLCTYLEDAGPPLQGDRLQEVEDFLNESPMSYLGMNSPRSALFGCDDPGRNSPTSSSEEP